MDVKGKETDHTKHEEKNSASISLCLVHVVNNNNQFIH